MLYFVVQLCSFGYIPLSIPSETYVISHGCRSTLYLQYDFDKDDDNDDDDNDDDDNDDEDDEDHYSCNSVNFQARTSRFCMEVDLHNTYNM